MLVLTRKENEEIRIGKDIILTVVSIQGGKVRLGLAAPPEVAIVRTELDRRGVVVDRRASV